MSEFLTYSLRTGACIAVFYLFFKLLLSRETFHAFNRALVLAATAVSFVLPLCVITVQRTLPARETVSTSDEYPYPAYADIVTPAADTPTDAPAGGSLSAARVMAASATPLPEETVVSEPEVMVAPLTEEDILSDHTSAESVAAVQPSVSEAVETSRGVEIPWRQIGIVIYLAGVAAVIFVTVRSIVGLHRLMRRGRCERLDDGTTLVRMDENVAPISWCRNIVISERDLRENGAAILAHERAHVRLHHSLDLLLVDLAGAVQWFNPAMWLLRRDLRAIHEYEADAAVIASGVDARSYQLLLIRKAVGGRWYSIANSFNHSKLKKRITMMLKEKSSPWARLKYLYVLPVAAIAVTAFARPEVSNKVEEISSVKVNDLAAIVETKMTESVGDTMKPADVKYVPTEVRKQLKGTPVFEVVEEMPEFPGGGMSALMSYLKDNMRYPASAKEKGTQGRVTVQFVVDKDGSIKEPKLLRSVDKDMDAEALRLISNMPKWKPGRQKGQPVAVKYTVPVMFSLDDDKLEKTSSANGITVEGYAGNGKEPLYIVDGKEVTPSVMSALDPNKIERVTVLKDKSATELYGEKGKNGVLLITLKQGTPGIVIRRDKEVTENAKVQHNGSLDLTKTIYIDGEKVDLGTKTIDDLIPAENIESIEVKKEAGGKGEIYIATKKTKAVEKTSVQGNMKVEGKVVDEQGEPIIGAAVLIEGTTTGSVTDVNGNFVLSVPSKDAVLVASYIGMATGKVKARPKLTITLKNE